LLVVERQMDRLARELRRRQQEPEPCGRERAEEALAELRRMRADLERWLQGSETELYRRNLGRFSRGLERRLERLAADLRAPSPRPARDGWQEAKPPTSRAGIRGGPAAMLIVPANDDCAAATAIGDGDYAGDTTAATVDGESGCGASVAGPDVWFRYVASASGEVMFNTFGSTFDTVLSLHSGCPGIPGNELACNDDAVGVQSELTRLLEPGDEVVVRIGGFAGDYGAFQLAVGRPVEIVGTVTDNQTGFGLGDVDVDVFDETGSWRADAWTAASGAFSIGGLPQGTYYAKASHPTYQAELYDDVPCPDYCDPTTGTAIALELGDAVQADFALDRAGGIEGWITDAASGAPVHEVEVRVYDHKGYRAGGTSDANGFYSFTGLAPDSYFVLVRSGSGYLGELFDDIPCPSDCDPTTGTAITVEVGGLARADFALQRGGSIAGRVTDALTGQPIADADVAVVGSQGDWVGSDRTDVSGRYAVTGLGTGTFFALAMSYHHLDQLYDGLDCPSGCDATGGTPIAVAVGVETGGIDFALVHEAAFSGQVVDDVAGVAVADVSIDAWDDLGSWVGYGGSDSSGVYSVGGLAAGTFFASTHNYSGHLDELYDDLPCFAGGCDPVAGSPIAVAAGLTTTGVDFALAYGASISGRLFEVAQGAGLEGRLQLWTSGGDEIGNDYFDGDYTWIGLPTGLYFVSTNLWAWTGYTNELYDDLPCPLGCDPTTGTPVAVTAGAETTGIDLGLCGRPSVLAYFPPDSHPDSFIDGCRVQVGGMTSPYHPSCPPVTRVHWEWGDGKQGDAAFPASHMYEPGHELVTASVTAYNALGLESVERSGQLHLWDCLAAGACGHPEDRQLYNLVLESTELIQACSTILLGPALTVQDPGEVTFVAGGSVILADGVRFEGGRVEIGIDPGLLP
jgi:hypothetical protein